MNPGKILLVEDDQLSRMILTRTLKSAGFELLVAEDGERGLEMARQHHPDVILSDWMMPRMDGPQLCQLIKSDSKLRYSYFILLSARGKINDRVDGLTTGADEYLSKPCPDEELIARLQAGLRLVRLQQEMLRLQDELAQKNRILERLALTDSLTTLYNRRYFQEASEEEIARAKRFGHPISLMMCDIDNFKTINDTYGHLAGDKVLVDIASIFKEYTRASDVVARYGGEEFTILLPESDLIGAMAVAERIRCEISDHLFILPESYPPVHLTISFGVAQWQNERHKELNDFLREADTALFCAKRSGKNRVCADSALAVDGG